MSDAATGDLEMKFLRPDEDVNLSNCDREPIHIPGSIQPHGALLALDARNLEAVQVSANSAALLGRSPEALLGETLAGLLGDEAYARLRTALAAEASKYARPLHIEVAGRPFVVVPHAVGDLKLLELEPRAPQQTPSPDDFYLGVREAAVRLQDAHSLAELCAVIAQEVRHLTGIDRVMIYEFDEDWHGEVVSEAKAAGVEGFLGLHFPATDIPVQARRLYTVNWIRHIADVGYESVPMVAQRPQPPLDMSHAFLRSVSPIHVQYLKNMGVGASLSISLLHEGKLWGLVACHHHQPLHVPYETLMACEFLGQLFSMQLAARLESDDARHRLAVKGALVNSLERLAKGSELLPAIADSSADLLRAMEASGLAAIKGEDVRLFGVTPPEAFVHDLAEWLAGVQDGPLYATDALSEVYAPAGEHLASAAGVLSLSVSAVQRLTLLWFRPEVLQTVTWGGKPDKVEPDETLVPRASFAAWEEEVQGRALPWRAEQLSGALELQGALLSALLRHLSQTLPEETQSELQAFAYVASHDLKEPLRGIHNFSSFLLEDYGERLDTEGVAMLETLVRLSQRMEGLINSLLHFSRVGRLDLSIREVDLNEVMEGVRDLLAARLREPGAELVVPRPLPVVLADDVRLTEVLTNLVGNALKYNSGQVRVEVGYLDPSIDPSEGEGLTMYVKDDGIGIPPEHHEAVFRLFKRLHGRDAYGGGTGLGLAIVKRIVERHGGKTWLESTEGQGSTFFFTLPPALMATGGVP